MKSLRGWDSHDSGFFIGNKPAKSLRLRDLTTPLPAIARGVEIAAEGISQRVRGFQQLSVLCGMVEAGSDEIPCGC